MFPGLCSERSLLACNSNNNIVAVQASWEKESERGWVLVRDCLASEVEFITTVAYEGSVWTKVRGERGRLALYIGCVYINVY